MPIGKNKFALQTSGPAAGPIVGWETKLFLSERTSLPSRQLVQLQDLVGWEIKLFLWGRTSLPIIVGWETKLFRLGRTSWPSRQLVQLLDP